MRGQHVPTAGGYRAVLFDLDGTLADTAPDMVAVLVELMRRNNQRSLEYSAIRANVSNGAIGLLKLGFPDASDTDLKFLHEQYLQEYAQAVCQKTVVFDPLRSTLKTLEANDRPWGVVTNKPEHLTFPLMERLGIADNAGCIVCGDTLPQRKPHPEPMLLAATRIGIAADKILYVGDAARDIEAGKAANMATIAAGYGYITADDNAHNWGADALVTDTIELSQLVLQALDISNS